MKRMVPDRALQTGGSLLLLILLLAGCAGQAGTGPGASGSPAGPAPSATTGNQGMVQREVDIGALDAQLEAQEAETFAGLWIQHEPAYRVVVAFTRNGEETIRPYVENTPLAGLIEVRTAEATLAELKAAQQEAHRLLNQAELPVDSSILVQENRVELYVTDRALFDATLQARNIQLPDRVEVVTVYTPLGDDLPFPVTPDPSVHFPQLRMRSASFMQALLQGRLILWNGCLRVSASADSPGSLIIWQPDYFVNNRDGMIEILDRNGQVVARVGEPISMGGGEVPMTFEGQLRKPLPEQCAGPYWLMGELTSPLPISVPGRVLPDTLAWDPAGR